MSTATATPTKNVKQTSLELEGKVTNWNLVKDQDQKYIFGLARYGALRELIDARFYNAETNEGEQRVLTQRHVKKIKEAMGTPRYKVACFYFGTNEGHRNSMDFSEDGKRVSLTVIPENKLLIVDANHRRSALELIRAESPEWRGKVDRLYVPYILYLDGDPKEQFIALQEGLPVSKPQMMSMKSSAGLLSENHEMGIEIAQLLNKDGDSVFKNTIQFDSRGTGKLSLNINSLCDKGAKSLLFTLFGSSKIAKKFGKDSEWVAERINEVYSSVGADDDGLLLFGDEKLLQPMPYGSKTGSAFHIALGNLLACRCLLKEIDEPDSDDLELFVEVVKDYFDTADVRGNSSNDDRVKLIHEVAVDFFEDLKMPSHEGIPIALINLLQPSSWGVSKVPTPSATGKKRGRPKKVMPSAPEENGGETVEETEEEVKPTVTSTDDPEWEDNEGSKPQDETLPSDTE